MIQVAFVVVVGVVFAVVVGGGVVVVVGGGGGGCTRGSAPLNKRAARAPERGCQSSR